MTTFESLGLSQQFLAEIKAAKFEEPSEIQAKTIPLALAGKDIIGGSATGSGKTLAFGAVIIEKAEKGIPLQALILTPTRELAEQIMKVLTTFSAWKGLEVAAIYGGVSYSPQIEALLSAEIIVATPGRALDHLKQGVMNLKNLKILVLDEADRMLDMGFIDDVEAIVKHCPKERQTLLFSATISADIEYLAKSYQKNPVEVSVESYVDASKLQQNFYDTPRELKFSLLLHLLRKEHGGLVMVFCNTRMNADFVANNLNHHKMEATAIHGGLTQQKRLKIMEKFHSKDVFVLVCTDVAARGLDIKGVSHVYNYDCPKTDTEYIHRVGRTARAGHEGMAISLICDRDYENFRRVLENKDLHIEQLDVPEVERVRLQIDEGSRRGGFRGREGDRRGNYGHGSRSGSSRSSGRSRR